MIGKFIALTALLLVLHKPYYPNILVVHEWGTFTTLAASDGTAPSLPTDYIWTKSHYRIL